jgi:hypothetical protein
MCMVAVLCGGAACCSMACLCAASPAVLLLCAPFHHCPSCLLALPSTSASLLAAHLNARLTYSICAARSQHATVVVFRLKLLLKQNSTIETERIWNRTARCAGLASVSGSRAATVCWRCQAQQLRCRWRDSGATPATQRHSRCVHIFRSLSRQFVWTLHGIMRHGAQQLHNNVCCRLQFGCCPGSAGALTAVRSTC